MAFTETTTTSYSKRIVGALLGILFGIAMFIASFHFIWWNEGRSVERIKTLKEATENVVSISSENINLANNQKLIHTSGLATTNLALVDEQFGIKEKVLKLKRNVEMYQWKEITESTTKKNLGGSETETKTYRYKKIWVDKHINSGSFYHTQRKAHKNPDRIPFSNKLHQASDATIGAFQLTPVFIGKINKYENYYLSPNNYDQIRPDLKNYFKLVDGQYWHGNPEEPKIGDVRITYQIVKPLIVSIIGQQVITHVGSGQVGRGDRISIDTYYAKNGTINLIEIGSNDAKTMLSNAEKRNIFLTWAFRFAGFIIMFAGLFLILNPIAVISDFIPFIGSIISVGIGLISAVIALPFTLITMAIAWIYYRPLIGSALLICAALCVVFGYRLIKKRKKLELKHTDGAATLEM